MNMNTKNFYEILGISPDATNNEIRTAYLKKVRENHPDKFKLDENTEFWKIANQYIQLLNQAYKVLSDPYKREQYDNANNFAKSNEKSFNETNNSKVNDIKRNIEKNHYLNFEKLPNSVKNILLKRQKAQLDDQIVFETRSIFLSYIWISIIIAWFPFYYQLADNSKWSQKAVVILSLVTIFCCIFFFRALRWILRWHNSKLKCNIFITPLYFIETELSDINFWWLWDINDIKATHNYKNKEYQDTTVKFRLAGKSKDMAFNSKEKYNGFIEYLDTKIKKATKAYNENDWEYFKKHDDFQDVDLNKKYNKPKSKAPYFYYTFFVILGCFISFLGYSRNLQISHKPHNLVTKPQNSINKQISKKQSDDFLKTLLPEFTEPELPLPYNGKSKKFTYKESVAPLKIKTQSDKSYFVKLTDYYSAKVIQTIFIRPYREVSVKVPLGSYIIKYAVGDKWYGENYLFGPETQYYKAEETFVFRQIGNQVSGYTIELFLQQDGNLETSNISPSDF